MTVILMILSTATYIIGRCADIWTSSVGIYYGTQEGNKLWADKYSSFSLKKNLIASIGLGVAIFIASLYVDYLFTLYLPFAFGSLYVAYANHKLQKGIRADQIAFLTHLQQIQRDGADQPHIDEAFNDRYIISQSGRAWYDIFKWIWEPGEAGDDLVRQRLVARIARLSLQPESTWFPK